MNAYFVIVSPRDDTLLYEADFMFEPDANKDKLAGKLSMLAGEDGLPLLTLLQFVAFGALDMVDLVAKKTVQSYLRTVDAFGPAWSVSAFVMPSSVRLLLVHDKPKADESIRHFFADVADTFAKVVQNPFYVPWQPLSPALVTPETTGLHGPPSPAMQRTLDECVRKAYRKHLQTV